MTKEQLLELRAAIIASEGAGLDSHEVEAALESIDAHLAALELLEDSRGR